MFAVTLQGGDAVTKSVQVNDAVDFRSAGGEQIHGTISYVGPGEFGVRYSGTAEPDRQDISLAIQRQGGIGAQIRSALGSLTDLGQIKLEMPTLQEMIRDFARFLGVDEQLLDVQVTGASDDRAVQLTLPIHLDPLTFTETIDLSGQVPGISLSGAGNLLVTVDPQFSITLGIRTAPGLSPPERLFIVDDATPEVTMNVSAQLFAGIGHVAG